MLLNTRATGNFTHMIPHNYVTRINIIKTTIRKCVICANNPSNSPLRQRSQDWSTTVTFLERRRGEGVVLQQRQTAE